MKQIEWIKKIRDTSPRVHCITNYVTAGDVANMVLALFPIFLGGQMFGKMLEMSGVFRVVRGSRAAVQR